MPSNRSGSPRRTSPRRVAPPRDVARARGGPKRARLAAAAALALSLLPSTAARAGEITKDGDVELLDDISQMAALDGTADFNAGPADASVPLDAYANQGMTFHTGALVNVLAGVTTQGAASQPVFHDWQQPDDYFPAPVSGGGTVDGLQNFFAGVVTFSEPVTQFGLTASLNDIQHITAWDQDGDMIGQVNWIPDGDAAFVGIDTGGVPIAMLAFGNDDLWNNQPYGVGGPTTISDHWVWSKGFGCQSDDECQDDDACNGAEVCQDSLCAPAPGPLACDDLNECTDDSCDPDIGCVNDPNSEPCDDQDLCTVNDVCDGGECVGEALECADEELCTADGCDPQSGCVNEPVSGCCEEDADCVEGVEICDLEANACEPLDDSSSSGEATSDAGTTEGPTSDSGTDTDGDTDTDPTVDPTADPTADVTVSGTGETTFGATEGPEGGCGCRSDGHAPPGLLLGLWLWFGARRRRGRAR